MLYQQRLLYNKRWLSALLATKTLSVLRLLGLVFSTLGSALAVFYLVYPSACPKWFYAEAYLLFFILTTGLFLYLPRIQARYIAWLTNAGKPASQKLARRMIAGAWKRIPFEAKYVIHGDQINYFRGNDNQWQQAWSRKMKGFALLGKNATLMFRKSTSLIPTLLILHHDHKAMESVCKDLGIECKVSD